MPSRGILSPRQTTRHCPSVLYCATVSRLATAVLLVGLLAAAGCAIASPQEQREKNEVKLAGEGVDALKPGDQAPPFTSQDHTGNTLQIPSAQGERRCVLFFYPADMTPNSTRELLQLSAVLEELSQQGIDLYGISGGSTAEHARYAQRYGINVPLLDDQDLSVARTYGCVPESGKLVQRTLVGIEADGTIGFFERGFPLGRPAASIYKWFGIEQPAAAESN